MKEASFRFPFSRLQNLIIVFRHHQRTEKTKSHFRRNVVIFHRATNCGITTALYMLSMCSMHSFQLFFHAIPTKSHIIHNEEKRNQDEHKFRKAHHTMYASCVANAEPHSRESSLAHSFDVSPVYWFGKMLNMWCGLMAVVCYTYYCTAFINCSPCITQVYSNRHVIRKICRDELFISALCRILHRWKTFVVFSSRLHSFFELFCTRNRWINHFYSIVVHHCCWRCNSNTFFHHMFVVLCSINRRTKNRRIDYVCSFINCEFYRFYFNAENSSYNERKTKAFNANFNVPSTSGILLVLSLH